MAASIGLELSDTVVRAAVLERRGSAHRLVGSASAAWTGASPEELASSLAQLRKTLGIKQPVVVGVPAHWATVSTVQPLVVNPRRESLAVQFELQQQLPYDASQVVWHYQWLGSNGHAKTPSATRHAVVAAIKRALLEERLDACRRAGLAIRSVSVGALAAANFWFRFGASGASGPAVLLYSCGPWLEWIGVDREALTVLPVSLSEAGTAQDVQAWASQVQAAWSGVQDALAAQGAVSAVWLFGEGAGVRTQTLQRELQCAVHTLTASSNLPGAGAGSVDPAELIVPCGLALQGLGDARVSLNLLIERQERRAAQQAGRMVWAIAALAGLLAIGAGASGMLTVLYEREAALQQLSVQEQTYQALRPEIRALTQKQAKLEERLGLLRELGQRRTLLTEALPRIAEALPEEVWLTKLELTKEDRSMNGLFEGYARSFQGVTRLMDQLKSSIGWTNVKPLATTVTPDAATGKELIVFAVQSRQPLPGWQTVEEEAGASDAKKPEKSKSSKSSTTRTRDEKSSGRRDALGESHRSGASDSASRKADRGGSAERRRGEP